MKNDLKSEPLLNQKEFTPSDVQIILENVKSKYENLCLNINDLKDMLMLMERKRKIPYYKRTKKDNEILENLIKRYKLKKSVCNFNEMCDYVAAYANALDESKLPPEAYSDIYDILEKMIKKMDDHVSFYQKCLSAINDPNS